MAEEQANKSLSTASTSSAESLPSLDNGVERPAVLLRNNRVPGAFTSYIRRRGEPDGRTACSDSSNKVRRPGGGESDAAFTPSPPVASQTIVELSSTLKNNQQSRMKSVCSSLAEVKIDTACQQRSPDSSCSSSSVTEWDSNGHSNLTVRRLPPLPPLSRKPPPPPFYNQLIEELNKLPQRPQHLALNCLGMKHFNVKNSTANDKISAFVESNLGNSSRLLYFSPEQEISSSSGDGGTSGVPSGIQDQLRATQMTRLNRDLTPTISEVYHERSIGLGLAPSLTKLLLPQAEEPETSYDSKNNEKNKAWLSSAELQRFYPADLITESDIKARSVSPCSELSRRDEGDGRSIADSQCSAGSYNRNTRQVPSSEYEDSSGFSKSDSQDELNVKTKVSQKQLTQDMRTSKPNSSSIC